MRVSSVRRLGILLTSVIFAWLACVGARSKEPRLFLWVWETRTDLRKLDTARAGVAYLAGSILLRGDSLEALPRRQPLVVPPGTHLIAVVRVDVSRREAPAYSAIAPSAAAAAVLRLARVERAIDAGRVAGSTTGPAPSVEGVQVDFDVPASGRAFYAALLREVRARLQPGVSLSMTALASWCLGDPWISGLPVDEAVPMFFRMGADGRHVGLLLKRGQDFTVPACRHSLGVSIDEPRPARMRGRRLFVFNPPGWTDHSAARALAEDSP